MPAFQMDATSSPTLMISIWFAIAMILMRCLLWFAQLCIAFATSMSTWASLQHGARRRARALRTCTPSARNSGSPTSHWNNAVSRSWERQWELVNTSKGIDPTLLLRRRSYSNLSSLLFRHRGFFCTFVPYRGSTTSSGRLPQLIPPGSRSSTIQLLLRPFKRCS